MLQTQVYIQYPNMQKVQICKRYIYCEFANFSGYTEKAVYIQHKFPWCSRRLLECCAVKKASDLALPANKQARQTNMSNSKTKQNKATLQQRTANNSTNLIRQTRGRGRIHRDPSPGHPYARRAASQAASRHAAGEGLACGAWGNLQKQAKSDTNTSEQSRQQDISKGEGMYLPDSVARFLVNTSSLFGLRETGDDEEMADNRQ